MLAIAMVAFIIVSNRDFGPMKKAEMRARQGRIMDVIPSQWSVQKSP